MSQACCRIRVPDPQTWQDCLNPVYPLAFRPISPTLEAGETKSSKEGFHIKRDIHILLVEDNSKDATLFRRAVNRINSDATIFHVVDATAASVFLKQDGAYPDAPR